MKKKLSVVIPCYNEEDGISELLKRVNQVCMICMNQECDYEILLVNDGSTDNTWQKMNEAMAEYTHLSIINLSKNHGHQLALTAGLSVCSGDLILILDADLQDPPELLPDMLKKMEQEKADVVYGQRAHRKGESFFKLLTAKTFYRLLSYTTNVKIPVDTGDFRLMTRRVLQDFLKMPEHSRFIRGMISWIGYKQVPILYNRDARFCGETKYPFSKMLRLAIDAITAFSIKPLRLGIMFGIGGGIIGILILIYCLYSYFFLRTVSGWTSILSAVVIIGSIQLFLLGVIGEYIGRIYTESQNRPLFTIAEIKCGRECQNNLDSSLNQEKQDI